jgi:cytidine deaminase
MLAADAKARLVEGALEARENAYAPYSHFAVGACLLTEDGSYYRGCNIENSSYGATNCAERTAIFKAVSEGHRRLCGIAIAGGPEGEAPNGYAYPCGICRQVMSEFAGPDLPVLVAKSSSDVKEFTLGELLACSFTSENLV